MSNLPISVTFGIFLIFTITNGGRSGNPPNDRLATGVWGGEHIRAEITDSGADIEFDCAHGSIGQAIVLDAKGGFDVNGKYEAQHGGPIRDDEDNSLTVRYVGHVKGKKLSLTITNLNSNEAIGHYNLSYGSDGLVRKCR
jgi:hypothetical protein